MAENQKCPLLLLRFQTPLAKRLMLVTILLMILSLSACSFASDTFRPPNQNELEIFVKDQGITPIAEKIFGDSVLLLYENSTSFGYYALSIREPNGEMVISQLSVAKSGEPIFVMDQLSGEYPFVAVIIEDPKLIAETTTLAVNINSQNPLTATTNGQAGAILVSPSLVDGWGTVTLYDAQGKVLYAQER
jgi:hypothetical protein